MRAANCMRDYGTTNNTPAHQVPPVWRAPEGLEDLTAAQVAAAEPVNTQTTSPNDRGRREACGAWPGITQTPRPIGGRREACGAWPRCRWAAAGHRADAPSTIIRKGPTGVEDTGGNCRGAGGRWQGLAGLRDRPLRAQLAARTASGRGAAPPVWRTPEGPAAVPVGGGRAWPGFEIDHSERSSRVAISRAGRRPPAPTRRHKHSATNA